MSIQQLMLGSVGPHINTLLNVNLDHEVVYSGPPFFGASASLYFNNDGTVAVTGSNSSIGGKPNWYIPATSGIGDFYWVRISLDSHSGTKSPTYGNMQLNTWYQIDSTQIFNVEISNLGFLFDTYNIEFSKNGSSVDTTVSNLLSVLLSAENFV